MAVSRGDLADAVLQIETTAIDAANHTSAEDVHAKNFIDITSEPGRGCYVRGPITIRTLDGYQVIGCKVNTESNDRVPRATVPIRLGKIAYLCVVILCATGLVEATSAQSIALESLPPPPNALATLIDSGAVTMTAGSETRPKLDDNRYVDQPTIVAETHYRITYRFTSRARWVLRGNRLAIRVKFGDVRLESTHVIWFQNLPERDSFWNVAVVRHEFDHVRISNDPRHEKMFRELLKEHSIITQTVESSQPISDASVDKIVETMVAEQFQKVSELIEIRYQELDRVTNHGLRPIPDDSPINDWIKPPTD